MQCTEGRPVHVVNGVQVDGQPRQRDQLRQGAQRLRGCVNKVYRPLPFHALDGEGDVDHLVRARPRTPHFEISALLPRASR